MSFGVAEEDFGKIFWFRPFPAKIWTSTFDCFSHFWSSKIDFNSKIADFADSAGRLADVADVIWTALDLCLQKNLKSRWDSKTRWDNGTFVIVFWVRLSSDPINKRFYPLKGNLKWCAVLPQGETRRFYVHFLKEES